VAAAVEGTRAPLVFLHTWDGEGDRIGPLSRLLGPDQPLYGIEPPPDPHTRPRRVEGWLDHFAAALALLPLGPPYRLAGWSFGGVVALELARQLQEAGDEVAFVGMIDTWRPRRNPLGVRPYLAYHLGETLALPAECRRAYAEERYRFLVNREKARLKHAVRSRLSPVRRLGGARPAAAASASSRFDASQVPVRVSFLHYEATPYRSPVSLYRTAESTERQPGHDPSLGWSRLLVGGFEQVLVGGGHFTWFEPDHLPSFAAALQRSLAPAAPVGGTRHKGPQVPCAAAER
jgi:thioesterase domain-containing protein